MSPNTAIILRLFAVTALATLASPRCTAAVMDLGDGHSIPGISAARLDVSLTSGVGEDVAAAQFDVTFDGSQLRVSNVEAGDAAVTAGKEVSFSQIDSNTVRVIVSGFNLDVIPDGVIAIVSMRAVVSATPGIEPVTMLNAVLSDPLGNSVPVTTTAGSVEILDPALLPTGLSAPLKLIGLCLLIGVSGIINCLRGSVQ